MSKQRVFMAVLAAGASSRFGEADKLAAPFKGKRLGEYVCGNAPLELIAPHCARVISSRAQHPCKSAWERLGFTLAVNPHASKGMGTSVAMAARLAADARCDALLIALADMPLVPSEHFTALIMQCDAPGKVVCSADRQFRMPPAVFGCDHFGKLASLSGDTGARALLKAAQTLSCPREWLVDIDTPEALNSLG